MNNEVSLRRALDILRFEFGLADFAQETELAFYLSNAMDSLEKALESINPKSEFNLIDELHNLSETMTKENLERLANPYSNLQKRATQPLLLTFGGDSGIYADGHTTVEVPTISAKQKVANYLKKNQ